MTGIQTVSFDKNQEMTAQTLRAAADAVEYGNYEIAREKIVAANAMLEKLGSVKNLHLEDCYFDGKD